MWIAHEIPNELISVPLERAQIMATTTQISTIEMMMIVIFIRRSRSNLSYFGKNVEA